MIVNCIQFLPHGRRHSPDLLTSCNDCTVKIWDIHGMKVKTCLTFKDPINVASPHPNGELLAVYGDCI